VKKSTKPPPCNGPTHRLQPISLHATSLTQSHLITPQVLIPHTTTHQTLTPCNIHTASDPPSHTPNAHARRGNHTTNPNLHPKTTPPCLTTTHTVSKTPRLPSDGGAPHDHSTPSAPAECVPNALPTDANSVPPNGLSYLRHSSPQSVWVVISVGTPIGINFRTAPEEGTLHTQ
jgi:hypothetical protein